ncbi:MAG TPA: TIR domain-containing protein [Steroidobacteraceae bacterium]|nr:TIR domain-containing protein [Steroidobacteraceae bacterium]
MSSAEPTDPQRPPPSVFLSYASEDRKAAQALRDALETYGLEVWYDESGLDGGDAWDQKIRRQIRECDFFMPVISAQTDARPEGYFRREWRLAVERTQDMADDHTFLLPVVIDDTTQARARVPDKFLAVQWTRVPGGEATAALEVVCRRLLSGHDVPADVPRPARGRTARAMPPPEERRYPQFPREEPGQRIRFLAHIAGWLLQSAWITFKRLPRWIQWIVWIWLAIVLMSRGCSVSRNWDRDEAAPAAPPATPKAPGGDTISPADARKLKNIADNYQGSSNTSDIARLGVQIAQTFANEVGKEVAAARAPVLAIPFAAPAGDEAARKLADSTFAQVYGRIAISHHGHVGLVNEPLSSPDTAAAVAQGRAREAKYVLYGTVEGQSPAQRLTVKLLAVKDSSVLWSESYPATGADPAAIASQVDAKIPAADEDD